MMLPNLFHVRTVAAICILSFIDVYFVKLGVRDMFKGEFSLNVLFGIDVPIILACLVD